MKSEFYWVGIVFDPDHDEKLREKLKDTPDAKPYWRQPEDDLLYDVISKVMGSFDTQGIVSTRNLPEGGFIFQCDVDGQTVVDVFRGGDGMRIGFGWSVDSLQEGMGLMDQAREWLATLGIRNRWVSVYLWDTVHTERKPAELVPPMHTEFQ